MKYNETSSNGLGDIERTRNSGDTKFKGKSHDLEL